MTGSPVPAETTPEGPCASARGMILTLAVGIGVSIAGVTAANAWLITDILGTVAVVDGQPHTIGGCGQRVAHK